MGTNLGSSYFFTISLVIYLVATITYILYAALKKEKIGKFATWFLSAGLIVQAVGLVLRTIEAGHAPIVNLYETLVFFSWLIAITYNGFSVDMPSLLR